MRRIGLLLALLVTGSAPAAAQSLPFKFALPTQSDPPAQHIDLRLAARHTAAPATEREALAPLAPAGDRWSDSFAIPGLSFEMAEIGAAGRGGKSQRFALVGLQGVKVLGANLGGSVDGRSAHLVLTWHTGQ